MTVLQGTMQDGTVLPVQVDSQGRLVAVGLDGAQGPAGPAGGAFPLPPDGFINAALVWDGSGLAWSSAIAAPVTDTIIGVAYDPLEIEGVSVGAINTTKEEVANVFDGDVNTYFGFNTSMPITDQGKLKDWVFTNPIRVEAGQTVQVVCTAGTVFGSQAVLSNGVTVLSNEAIYTAPSATSIVRINAMLYGASSLHTNIAELRINGGAPSGNSLHLDFASTQSLNRVHVGDRVRQTDLGAAGLVSRIDVALRRVWLSDATGTWTANGTNRLTTS